MADALGMVKRAKVEELARDFRRFTSGPLTKIIELVHQQRPKVFISKHFTERMVDRDFSKREDRLYMFKLLSYVFEKRGTTMLEDGDIFVKFKNFTVMIYSEFRDGIQQIRLNTFLPNEESTWLKAKNGRKMTMIEVHVTDLDGYVPINLVQA